MKRFTELKTSNENLTDAQSALADLARAIIEEAVAKTAVYEVNGNSECDPHERWLAEQHSFGAKRHSEHCNGLCKNAGTSWADEHAVIALGHILHSILMYR